MDSGMREYRAYTDREDGQVYLSVWEWDTDRFAPSSKNKPQAFKTLEAARVLADKDKHGIFLQTNR